MKVEISGARCISCVEFIQHYDEQARCINYGFCCEMQRITRPGNRCKNWRERSNIEERKSSTCK